MTRFWALIAAKRVHVFSLGKHEDESAAMDAAEDYCTKKTAEVADKVKGIEGAEPVEYLALAVLDVQDMRNLPGEFYRPFEIPQPEEREVVAVEPTKVLGGTEHTPPQTPVAV
jgi:hypothetical protein